MLKTVLRQAMCPEDEKIHHQYAGIAETGKMLDHLTFLLAQMEHLEIPQLDLCRIFDPLEKLRTFLDQPKISQLDLIATSESVAQAVAKAS
eukprot:m.114197 g.114197  ORF g.114197 m.114197 type:complete len:91 (-) comp15468_c0_seq4:404-676(-)